jgi:hypothetical protein
VRPADYLDQRADERALAAWLGLDRAERDQVHAAETPLQQAVGEHSSAWRQEAASEGRMAMRVRLAGSDPRHYEVDQDFYQRRSQGQQLAYPLAKHQALDRELGSDQTRVQPWPVGRHAKDWAARRSSRQREHQVHTHGRVLE